MSGFVSVHWKDGDREFTTVMDGIVQLPAFENKKAMEKTHFDRFAAVLQRDGSPLAMTWKETPPQGEDPPDFWVCRDGRAFGLEHTEIGLASRGRMKFFVELQRRLVDAHNDGRLRGLEGIELEVAFGDEAGANLRDLTDAEAGLLLDALEGLKSFRDDYLLDARSVNTRLQWPQGKLGDGGASWRVCGMSYERRRGTWVADVTGFNLVDSLGEQLAIDEIVQLIQERVEAKDGERPHARGVEELLVVAGGPNEHGVCFRRELHRALQFVVKGGRLPSAPKRLRRVYLLLWGAGADQVHVVYDVDRDASAVTGGAAAEGLSDPETAS